MLTKSAPSPFPSPRPHQRLTHKSQSPHPCSLDVLLLEKGHPMALGAAAQSPLSDLITVVSVRVEGCYSLKHLQLETVEEAA